MSNFIRDLTTRRMISVETAYERGFPSGRFTVPSNAVIFAVQDKRKSSGFKYELVTHKADIAALKRSKKARIVYPTPLSTSSVSLIPYKSQKHWEYNRFTAPLELLRLANAAGQMVTLEFMNDGVRVDTKDLDLRSITDIDKYWNDILSFSFNQSDIVLPELIETIGQADSLRITTFQPMTKARIQQLFQHQKFRDGVDHCILTPIIKYFQDLILEAKSKKTAQNRQSLLKNAQAFLEKYADGIPESEMDALAKKLDISIVIEDPVNNQLQRYNQKAKGKVFRFINSRIDHGELITLDLSEEAELIGKEEAVAIIDDCRIKGEFCLYTGSQCNPVTVRTASNYYRVGTDIGNAIFEFFKTFDFGCRIDSIKEQNLAKFLIAGSNFVINWRNTNKAPTNEIDMKRAYTQFKKAPQYMGFPAIINNYRRVSPDHDVVAHPGVYQVRILDIPTYSKNRSRAIPLLRAYGFKPGKFILTSPWIATLRDAGVSVETLYGAWGKRMDFEFSDDMIEKKAYAIWTGVQLHTEEDCKYKMACSAEYADMIRSISPDGSHMHYNHETQTLLITKPKDSHWIMPHVGAFIMSYCQLNVFQESLKYDVADIVGTKVDSIMLSTDIRDLNTDLFMDIREKPDFDGKIKIHKDACRPTIFNELSMPEPESEEAPVLTDAFISGQGGSGKTTKILGSKGFRKVLFVTRAWRLVTEMVGKFKVNGCSVNQLLGFDTAGKPTQSQKERFGQPGVIVADELSMWSAEEVNDLKKMYPYSQIILLGDYHDGKYYQASISKDLYHPESYILKTEDYRSLDEPTRAFKLACREIMDKYPDNRYALYDYIMTTNIFPRITHDQLKAEYDLDYVLTRTHDRAGIFTELLKHETKNHYLITRHAQSDVMKRLSEIKSGAETTTWLHGEIAQSPVEGRSELRHAFTIHSFQGITIPPNKRLYIDLAIPLCNQELYTAISRVQLLSQIKLL